MAKYLRTFHCRTCASHATLEQKKVGLTVIRCSYCEVQEIWREEIFMDQLLKNFQFQDLLVADC